ncbi:MAG: hypothetical protein ACLUOI_30420 [Eisenbergiella sp.]
MPKALRLSVDSCGIPLKADGSDIVAVRCSLADRDNNTVPLMGDRHPVLFEIEGEGMIVGDERIGANPVYPEAGIATVLIRSTCRAGVIRLRASMYWPQRGRQRSNRMRLRLLLYSFYSDSIVNICYFRPIYRK